MNQNMTKICVNIFGNELFSFERKNYSLRNLTKTINFKECCFPKSCLSLKTETIVKDVSLLESMHDLITHKGFMKFLSEIILI